MDEPAAFRWLLDVDALWPIPSGHYENAKATAHWATGREANRALSQLTLDEKAKVLRFYRPSDAKLSLASCLLKKRAIVDYCKVPWSEAVIGEDDNRKPCYVPHDACGKTLEFNVSHHGTLVVLVGFPAKTVKLGIDVVQMNWERDYLRVMKDGFEAWANVYEMVFSDREVNDIAGYVPPEHKSPQEEIRAKLRHFYAHWGLKEA